MCKYDHDYYLTVMLAKHEIPYYKLKLLLKNLPFTYIFEQQH